MPHVLDSPAPLSARARAFLTAHARLRPVGAGPGDDECRAAMRSAIGHSDEHALATFRRIQRRYSGLTYLSPFRRSEIVFEPVFEADPEAGRVVFPYAIMDTAPDGCRSGFVLPDEAVWFGLLDVDAPVFASLDHFLECDALLHHARRRRPVSTVTPPDAAAHLMALRDRHPLLRPIGAASGYCVAWWGDEERLVYVDGLDARLAADGRGASPVPVVVTTWLLGEPAPRPRSLT
ncbi:hypothetical protein [Actinoplanes sp. NPDC026623]|uniref:hypothetical protein n=1 Tax=Actinoplanes sp. NPDC026623 TaxID=3155610 RepID=UPI00340AA92F